MEEIVRKTIENGFEGIINENIQKEKRKNPNEWDNNPLFAISIITSAIGIAKEEYKKMLKLNCREFGIEISQIDDFIESLSKKIQKKYFE